VRAAAALFERAAALLPANHADRPEILADLHDALLFAGEIERAEAPVAELIASLAPDDRSPLAERARLQQAMLRFLLAPGATPIDTLRKEVERSIGRLEEAGDRGNLAQALADLATIHWVEGNAAAMLDASERALTHALACGSRRATAEAAPLIAYALHRGAVPLDEGLARLERTRSKLRDDRLARALIRLDEARMLAETGRSDDAHAAVDRARAIFADLGQRRWLEMSGATEAEIVRREDRHEQAEGLLRSVLAFFRDQGDANNALSIEASLADLLCDRGRHVEADLLAGEVARDAPSDDLEVQVEWRTARARTQAAAGDPETAVRLAEEAVSIAESTDFALLQAEAFRALGEALVSADRTDDAIDAYERAVDRYEAKRAIQPAAETRDRIRELTPR
jgi:tetratricopeptide (TPR) repeat protein